MTVLVTVDAVGDVTTRSSEGRLRPARRAAPPAPDPGHALTTDERRALAMARPTPKIRV